MVASGRRLSYTNRDVYRSMGRIVIGDAGFGYGWSRVYRVAFGAAAFIARVCGDGAGQSEHGAAGASASVGVHVLGDGCARRGGAARDCGGAFRRDRASRGADDGGCLHPGSVF